jgi:cytochrome c553
MKIIILKELEMIKSNKFIFITKNVLLAGCLSLLLLGCSDKDALKALKDKAGNVGTFKVSKLYRSRCASCHGVNGDGIIGPKLYGQTTKYVYDKMKDYKTGRLESPVMRGILINIDEKQLKLLSEEIGKFKK